MQLSGKRVKLGAVSCRTEPAPSGYLACFASSNFISFRAVRNVPGLSSQNYEVGAGAVKFIADVLKTTYGWKIEDTIHYCGTGNMDKATFEELPARAFKDGEMLAQ